MSLFILFGGVALTAGIGMVVQRNAVHAALLLVLNFLAVSLLFLTLGAEFLMISQIIVYAGAIMVLFLFVIMLLGIDRTEAIMDPRRFQVLQVVSGAVLGLLFTAGIFVALLSPVIRDPLPPAEQGFGEAGSIGELLFRSYLLPFELTSLLLLVAAVGILMLAKREHR